MGTIYRKTLRQNLSGGAKASDPQEIQGIPHLRRLLSFLSDIKKGVEDPNRGKGNG